MHRTNRASGIGLLFLFLLSTLSACRQLSDQRQPDQGPSLIPLPQSVKWTQERFPLNDCEGIVIKDSILRKEADGWLKMTGKDLPVKYKAGKSTKHYIQLKLEEVESPYGHQEAYHLKVSSKGIMLSANTPHGIFNGLQTLYQLIRKDTVYGCDITDYPAYRWRGYMVDVGRNYQSISQLKQQIAIMARYKLNVFHFHLTENVAWRLQIKQFPQLTAPENMLRNKGKSYSVSEMKELIQYCRDRYITLVPEIDMPGHSAAFTRATGVDMQSDSGPHIMKDIIREICTTYDIPYIHIGADEVAIRNNQFLPDIIRLIHQYNKKTIAWSPGGNYGDSTIHQLWGNDESRKESVKYIDSRALYLSDMDPESSVVSLFERQLGGKVHGDSRLLGAEICLWDDRRVAKEIDHLTMNAVYPDMLAFAERSWRGGGYPGTVLDIGPDSSARAKAFTAFEERLIDHKQQYFKQLPFPYVKQSQIHWKLFGPFENQGDLTASFWPENRNVSLKDSTAAIEATGGTIWLWYDKGEAFHTWVPSPKINTTWYAFTRFWSDADTSIAMWIGFKNLLRSLASATPPANQWDYKKSKIWMNGNIIPPPKWKYPGRNLAANLEAPLVDEGYYYRPPAMVNIKKGWNKILVKLPLKNFANLAPWQKRYMFSVMPVHKEQGINWYADNINFNVTDTAK